MSTHGEIPELASIRADYAGSTLLESNAPDDPWVLFGSWLGEALAAHADGYLAEPNAMSLATAVTDNDGLARPSVRMVLLKGHDADGITWFTNYESRKGVELARNPQAGVALHWAPLYRQVRMTGRVDKVSRDESVAYFASRPRGSQLAARASAQSRVVSGASALTERFAAEEDRWAGMEVPCPESWGGYRLNPELIEFWQGRPDRLHDRLVYRRVGRSWARDRLAP